MADISKFKLPSGNIYNLKDSEARKDIEDLKVGLTGAMHYLGSTTTQISDGATTSTINVEEEEKTLTEEDSGIVVIYDEKEFVWSGKKWSEFGSTGSLKALAFKENAQTEYIPSGTIGEITFTGQQETLEKEFTVTGSVEAPTFTGTQETISIDNYTPSGTIEVSIEELLSGNYTPKGTISAPTTTVELTKTKIKPITAVGALPTCTLPKLTADVKEEVLELGWTEGSYTNGTLPTQGAEIDVATDVESATTTAPTFIGTAVNITSTFAGSNETITTTFTPSGKVSAPKFTAESTTVSIEYMPKGEVSTPTFSGTPTTITVQ